MLASGAGVGNSFLRRLGSCAPYERNDMSETEVNSAGPETDVPVPAVPKARDEVARLLNQYGCGPIQFAGTANALYERHLLFDSVVGLAAAGPRERFEAIARSVRDVLAQRWVLTEETYARAEPQARLLPLDGVPDWPLAVQ